MTWLSSYKHVTENKSSKFRYFHWVLKSAESLFLEIALSLRILLCANCVNVQNWAYGTIKGYIRNHSWIFLFVSQGMSRIPNCPSTIVFISKRYWINKELTVIVNVTTKHASSTLSYLFFNLRMLFKVQWKQTY